MTSMKRFGEFITRTYIREISSEATGVLAAGPLEDLLNDFGELYVDEVVKRSRDDQKFNALLRGIYTSGLDAEIRKRIESEVGR